MQLFYVPKTGWQRLGGDPRVIGFFAARYRERYGDLWEEFVRAAGGGALATSDPEMRYVCEASTGMSSKRLSVAEVTASGRATYRAARLTFKADVIEPLSEEQSFTVITREGTFRMTKGEFYAAFPGVVASRSYKEGRIYNYRSAPMRAHRFKIEVEG